MKRQPHGASWGQTGGWKVTVDTGGKGPGDRDPGREQSSRSQGDERRGVGEEPGGRAGLEEGRGRRGPPISGAALSCGGPFSRLPAASSLTEAGRWGAGGFTGSGTRRLGPPALFPEPGATPPAPTGAVALGSFLWRTR